MEPPRSSNDDQTRYQAQYWNGPEAGDWLVDEHRDERTLAAFTARRLGPGGRLVFVCRQGLVDSEWVTVPAGAAAQHLPVPSLTEPGGPGPLSLSDRHHLAAVLDAAGLVDVASEPVAEPLWPGRDVADTVEFFTASGIGQTLLRDADPATSTRVMAAVQAALEAHLTSGGVRLASRGGSSPPATPGKRRGSSW